jgi:hypothetical protein
MPYTPPAYNAVNFDDVGSAYTPPAYNAVYFDDVDVSGFATWLFFLAFSPH